MSTTFTYSETFTRTHARYLASKVAADLRQLKTFYGRPSETEIDAYVDEVTELLVGGYLASVDYGFHRNDGWVVALNYTVLSDGTLGVDDRAGRVPPGADITGAHWYSFLRYSDKWHRLTSSERSNIKKAIPVDRSNANEPSLGTGNIWNSDKAYSAGGTSVSRRTMSAGG